MGRGKSRRSLELVDEAHDVPLEIQPASVRAVCYRLFTLGILDSMSKAETNRVSTQLTWAREHGVIPWGWIVDETREAERVNAWENPEAFIETVKRSYRRDRWSDQSEWVEVWSEKGTIRGTLAPVLEDYGVTFRVMHGYGSSTAVHQVAAESAQAGRVLTALYVGDFDPSGLHMSDVDLPRRLGAYGGSVHLIRLALTTEDTIIGNLPSFPASDKGPRPGSNGDSRYGWYRATYHNARCWELDALSPVILRQRVEREILDRLDREAWKRAEVAEAADASPSRPS